MSQFVWADNVNTTLASGITSSATSLTLTSSANLPTLTAGQVFVLTLNDAATQSVFEIVYCTAISGATCSGLSRGQEGTAAQAWLALDYAYATVTAGQLADLVQIGDEPGSGLVVLNPATAQTGAIDVTGSVTAGSIDTTGAVAAGSVNATGTVLASSDASAQAYVPPVYNATGGALADTTHIVTGLNTVTYTSSTGNILVTLSGAAVFSGTSSYQVVGSSDTGAIAVGTVPYSGTQFEIQIVNSTGGSGSTVVKWIAIGS